MIPPRVQTRQYSSQRSATGRRSGTADAPLHYGRAPRWLFGRMVLLARECALCIVEESGPEEVLRRLSDPWWFQAFGCVLGFDWHSSGVTTTVCGALKEGLRGLGRECGLYVCGGKGKASRKTPEELRRAGEETGLDPEPLVYASRTSAKVDSAAVQDGYQVYHHTFIMAAGGSWAVVQQGMNETAGLARRYHWLSEGVSDFVCEPHAAVCSDRTGAVLNLVAEESGLARSAVATLAREHTPEQLLAELRSLGSSAARPEPVEGRADRFPELMVPFGPAQGKLAAHHERISSQVVNRAAHLEMPRRHHIEAGDFDARRLAKPLAAAQDRHPEDFEALLGTEGVGARTLRALSLLAEVLYQTAPSFRDPARFSFAHGGKDGHPFPVDRATYDKSIEVLGRAVRRAKLGHRDELAALRRLARWEEPGVVAGAKAQASSQASLPFV